MSSRKLPQLDQPASAMESRESSIGLLTDVVHLITKQGFSAHQRRFSVLSVATSATSIDDVINIINPVYSDENELQASPVPDDVICFIEQSIKEILVSTSKENSEQAVMDFLKSFVHNDEPELSSLVKRILENDYFRRESPASQIISTTEPHTALVTQITAEAVGDIIEDYLRIPDKRCGALKQLHRCQADLRRLYYEKGCRMTQTNVKQALIHALMSENAGSGCVAIKGHSFDEEQLTDRDILALCVAVKLGLKISTLAIHHQRITDFGVWHIARMLKTNLWSLKHLDLRGNCIGGRGATFLAEIIAYHSGIKTLILAENKIGNIGGLAINKALRYNTHLAVLDLSGTDVTMESVVALVVAVRKHPGLRYLDLSRPLIFSKQEEPMIHMANTVKVNQVLKELHLQKFGITDYGIRIFVQGLMHNVGLTHLDLSCNGIVWDGVREIALFLQTNPLLNLLNLHANRIEDPGATDIANALAKHNRNLKKLIITNNNIESKGLCAMVKCLRENLTLSHLHIWGNKLETTACVALAEVLKSGRMDPECVDFRPYVVDGVTYLAKAGQPITTHNICCGKP